MNIGFLDAIEANTHVAAEHLFAIEGAARIDGEVIRWNVCDLILGHDGFRRMLRWVLGLICVKRQAEPRIIPYFLVELRNRTPDPHTASVVRYQLRHSPRCAHRNYTTGGPASKSLVRVTRPRPPAPVAEAACAPAARCRGFPARTATRSTPPPGWPR